MREFISFNIKYNSTGQDTNNKIILTEIENLIKKYGQCYLTNLQFGELLCLSESAIEVRISTLRKANLIECHTKFVRKHRTRSIKLVNLVNKGQVNPVNKGISSKEEKETPLEHLISDSAGPNPNPILTIGKEDLDHIKIIEDPGRHSPQLRFDEFVSKAVKKEELQLEEPLLSPYEADIEILEITLNDFFDNLPTWKKMLNTMGHRKFIEKTFYQFKLNEWIMDVIIAYSKYPIVKNT